MTSYFSRKGDDGTTSWLGKGRIKKFDLRLETLGSLDESSAFLGMARTQAKSEQNKEIILQLQRDLYTVMSEVAADPKNASHFPIIQAERVAWLEEQIDLFTRTVGYPDGFVMPGDAPGGGSLDVARTVIRRAERRVVELHDAGGIHNPIILSYLNRLSSLIFVMELVEIKAAGVNPPNLNKKISPI
jgi:cob(I)alamin adenosyltransferase